MARELTRGFFELTGWAMRTGAGIFHGIMQFINPLIEPGRRLIGVVMEGGRALGVLWDAVGQAAGAVMRGFEIITGGAGLRAASWTPLVTGMQNVAAVA